MKLSNLKRDLKYIKSKKIISKARVNKNTIEFLMKIFHWCEDFSQMIYSYKNNIRFMPICGIEGCNNQCSYSNAKKYSSGCSFQHSTILNNNAKYGVDNVSQLTSTKNKIKKTSFARFGHSNIFKSDAFKQQLKKDNLHKYGVTHNSQRKEIINNIKLTNLKKYGTVCSLHNTKVKAKCVTTWMEKYNVDHFTKSKIVQQKRIGTKKKKYIKQLVNSLKNIVTPKFKLEDYDGKNNIYEWHCLKCNKSFAHQNNSNSFIPRCLNCHPIHQKVSGLEQELFNSINVPTKIQSDRTILNSKEVDIYLPDYNIAIEFNGIYWHSELNGKDKNYHLNKTQLCHEKGIQLLHIFETEWIEKPEIIKSIIKAKLGKYDNRIFGRKTVIKEITPKQKSFFLNSHHLQGDDKSSIRLGLFHNSEVVAVMTFGKSRYNKSYDYEMHRFCNKSGYQIIGGASKLFKYFIRNYQPKAVITYADRRYSDGSLYEKLGFDKLRLSPPNHFYFKGGSGLMSRIAWQKHKLKDKLEMFDEKLTAWQNMQVNGYDRIYDCGNYVFGWNC